MNFKPATKVPAAVKTSGPQDRKTAGPQDYYSSFRASTFSENFQIPFLNMNAS